MQGASAAERIEKDLVLVGGGHAHVQILRRFMMEPVAGVRLTLVVDRYEALYSGMVPGAVAGDYALHELEIDVLPLARRAGARCIRAAAIGIDPLARTIRLAEGRAPLRYDVASLDIGSSVRGLDTPGVREHAVATRPIAGLLPALDAALEARASQDGPLRIVVVGSGAAGVELALCVEARLAAQGTACAVTLTGERDRILPGASDALREHVERELERRGVALRLGVRATRVEPGAVALVEPTANEAHEAAEVSEQHVPADVVLWASGAAPQPRFDASALPTDEAGFVRTRSTLQVEGHDDLFAVGDCAALIDHAWVPRAGVYAVREGPVLDRNLRARLRGDPLRRYRPQHDFLALINYGGHRAAGGKWGRAAEGERVWRLKDRIDRRFMERFQVLDEHGAPARRFPPPMPEDPDAPMECGGCAAKVGPSALSDALARLPAAPDDPTVRLGVAQADDAAAFETAKGDLLLATVDGFRAFTDDPWLVGRVAAVNAVSDVQAKGGRARHALAVVTVPDEGPARSAETLYQVLAGVRAALDPLGVSLVGGHSTLGPELFVGLSLTGDLPGDGGWLPLDGLRPGDALVLSKPLGSGVLLAADMRGLATGRWMETAQRSLVRDNDAAATIARAAGASASTDVSGFGLAAHLLEMLDASRASASLQLSALPLLDGAATLAERGLRSSYHAQNATIGPRLGPPPTGAEARAELLFDPQTSGGLLLGIDAARADGLVAQLHAAGYGGAARIGRVEERAGGTDPTLQLSA